MRLRRIDILGGGPAGLYLARLLKLRQPSWKVLVHEPLPPGETFGFGVGFTRQTLRNLAAADLDTYSAILAAAHSLERSEFRTGSGIAFTPVSGNVAIERATLLRLLLERAVAVGAEVEIGQRRQYSDLRDADVVVAADGVGSATRQALASVLGDEGTTGAGLYLWCGAAGVPLGGTTFASVETEHGLFVTHAYPYRDERGTFLVETDETTWHRAGLDEAAATTPPGETDEVSLRYLEDAFCDLLSGSKLIGNRTQWRRFRTIRCRRWHHENIVLIGDAAHTAHYSVGSGTKMAMEDAIALCEALLANDDLSTAFAQFERSRRPAVERLQALAARSQAWWESYGMRIHLPAAQLLVSYFTRMGTVRLSQLATTDRPTVSTAVAAFVTEPMQVEDTRSLAERVLTEPFRKGSVFLPGRLIDGSWNGVSPAVVTIPCDEVGLRTVGTSRLDDPSTDTENQPPYVEVLSPDAARAARERFPGSLLIGVVTAGPIPAWVPAGEAVLADCRRFLDAGCDGIRLDAGDTDRNALLSRLDLAERVRVETGGVAVVEGAPEYIDDLVAGLVTNRADLVALPIANNESRPAEEEGGVLDVL
jgi:anthraniloyl-CoA monooxygenase